MPIGAFFEPEELGDVNWLELAELAAENPTEFVAATAAIQEIDWSSDLLAQLRGVGSFRAVSKDQYLETA